MLLATVLAVISASGPAPAIRTGGPSAPADPKVAIVGGGRAGQKFRVTRGTKVVLRGRLKPTPGDASPWTSAAAANLSKLGTGSYVVHVGSHKSRPWRVTPSAKAGAIARLLRIYSANSDGNEPSLFPPAHLNDATVKGGAHDGQHFDLVGGWRDAGDNIKFTRTTAQSVAYLYIAARLAPDQAEALKAIAGIGERYLLKAHPAPDLFISTVGDDSDHELGFRDPSKDDTNSDPAIARRFAYPTVSSDVLGEAAAALAFSGHVAEAKQWYAQALATNGFADADREFYPDDSFHDELAFAADALWRATGEDAYLQQAYASCRPAPTTSSTAAS
jgi:hypothetical protein